MRRVLKLPSFIAIEYKKHEDSLADKSSYRYVHVTQTQGSSFIDCLITLLLDPDHCVAKTINTYIFSSIQVLVCCCYFAALRSVSSI